MTGTDLLTAPSTIRPRQISQADIPQVVGLLARGYGKEPRREFWEQMFAGLSRRPVPEGYPRYGYVIESDGRLVGAIILIFSTIWKNGSATIRCNGSGLYVDPAFRVYAPLLASRALKDRNVTVLNISAAPHTHKMVEASGFTKYSDGIFAALPMLSWRPAGQVRIIDGRQRPHAPFDPHERDLLLEHADYGCTSLWCVTREQAYPFVFRPRTVKFLPCAQLVYCRGVDSFVRFARPIGFYLARRLRLFVILDANGPVRGLVGRYFEDMPRFFNGPDRPQIGDLAYTETSLFGV